MRPGLAEIEPVLHRVINGTKIIATFDFTGQERSLYDLKVINPDGQEAIVPYRFQIERAIEPEVTIGVGGPRAILAGDVGTYSVALQNLSNLDAPYTYFQFGVPEMGINGWVYGLPYLDFFHNVRGAPEGGNLEDVPFASLDPTVNTVGNNGYNIASGFLFDQPADGFAGFSFNVATYPGLKEMHDRAFEEFRTRLYAAFPAYERQGLLDDGPEGLDLIVPGLSIVWNTFGAIPDLLTIPDRGFAGTGRAGIVHRAYCSRCRRSGRRNAGLPLRPLRPVR